MICFTYLQVIINYSAKFVVIKCLFDDEADI